jgi:hypothetical protein
LVEILLGFGRQLFDLPAQLGAGICLGSGWFCSRFGLHIALLAAVGSLSFHNRSTNLPADL